MIRKEKQRDEKKEADGVNARLSGKKGLRTWRTRILCIGGYLALCLCLTLRFPYKGMHFTMLDVGQGDGLFLRTEEGTTFLVDGGSTSVSEVGTYRMIPFLKQQGIGKLDYVTVTHTDADHISGMEELLLLAKEPGEIKIGTLLLTPQVEREETGLRLKALAEERGIAVRTWKAGDVLRDKSTEILCLHPQTEGIYADANGSSLVLQVTYGDFSMLLTGDLEEAGEQEILKNNRLKECDVLKVGHHGSNTSTTEEWLEALKPGLALISCGEDNAYGHPHQETMERLLKAGCRVFATPEWGAVTVYSDGTTFYAEGFKE